MAFSNDVVEVIVRVLAKRVAVLEHDTEWFKAEHSALLMLPVRSRKKSARKKFDATTAVPPWVIDAKRK